MKILIAEDDPVSRRILQVLLVKWGYEVVVTRDGNEAWQALQQGDAIQMVIFDWMMPGKDGVELCRRVREISGLDPFYIILLTAKASKEYIIEGFQAGADDYVTKPFESEELRARVQVGARVIGLQSELADRITELEEALSQIKQLHGFLSICSYCKKIHNDQNQWQQVESYVAEHSEAKFSHGICPTCYKIHVEPELAALKRRKQMEKKQV